MSGGTLAEALGHSLLAGGAGTTIGALPVLVVRRITAGVEAVLAGFSAGVMIAASFVGLLLPALDQARTTNGELGTLAVLGGTALGALAIAALHHFAPHQHFAMGDHTAARSRLAAVWLFAIALTLHNVPEGLAVGVGVASGDAEVSWPVTWAIAVQNAPEGLVVAVAFLAAGESRTKALLVTAATGLVEPIGALVGYGAVQVTTSLLPGALAFAAGAMLFVVSHEVIPESHRAGRSTGATFGLVGGVLLMLWLGTWLG